MYKQDKIVQEHFLIDSAEVKYQYLLPGNYVLKLIIDQNNDQEWNTGNYIEGIQPEKVLFYEKDITIKSNWDNDITWTIKK